jgi:hypothetical protein
MKLIEGHLYDIYEKAGFKLIGEAVYEGTLGNALLIFEEEQHVFSLSDGDIRIIIDESNLSKFQFNKKN